MNITKTELFTMLSLVIPFIFTLLLFRHTDIFSFLGLLVLNSIFIIGCLLILLLTKKTKFKKAYYFIATLIIISIFFISWNGLTNLADKIFFSIHKSKLNETVTIIEKARKDKIQIEIPQLYFASVDTLESGEIIFTLDGMLDNCVGIAYSKDNLNPGYTNCGRIITWIKFEDHWYWYYTT